ncbi:hypothetical protein AB0Y04_02595 [Loigolactobacillus coryniformis]|uniref:hypothetical protein n=1 Tax=Loigolactobacillus coryniformis TaxID=1610 RepID=UPI003F236542
MDAYEILDHINKAHAELSQIDDSDDDLINVTAVDDYVVNSILALQKAREITQAVIKHWEDD